ncbi:MAG: PleD family two-component system response regulator [Synechocystis sp.]|nr:PleD family two-component system response regulator [Synechocystis sp.]
MNQLSPTNPLDGQAATILVVDDDPFMQMQLKLYLQKEGHEVILAKDGQAALDQFATTQPELVLLDAMMPVLDGFDCCQRLVERYPDNPPLVLMITGLEDEASVDRAFAAGAIDYVTKPIHWAVLRQRVKRLLYQSRLQRQLESANKLLEKLSQIDALTQLANRRQLDLFLATEWQLALREQYSLTIMLCDVDYFKHYNDFYGHQAGDVCLQQVAKVLATVVGRPKDLVARYGGEEFMVVLPNTDAQGAKHLGHKIQTAIAALALPHARSAITDHLTLSIGAASIVPQPNSHWQTLIAQADQCLYQAKAQGRNRLVISPD